MSAPHRPRRLRRSAAAPRRERGIVVFVALIAVVLMSLAAVGLMRTVHTSTMVVGNLAFRQTAMSMSTAAVEKAVYDVVKPKTITDLKNHLTSRNYYATRQPCPTIYKDCQAGIPRALQGNLALYPADAQIINDPNDPTGQTRARYVIERMCLPAALGLAATAQFCEMIPPKQNTGTTGNIAGLMSLPDIPYYRMTVRVDGPGGSVSYSQAMIR